MTTPETFEEDDDAGGDEETSRPGRTGRIVVRLELTWRAKAALRRVTERTGCTQVTVSSRLIEWFARQSETVQAAVLGQIPEEVLPDVIEMALRNMAADQKQKK